MKKTIFILVVWAFSYLSFGQNVIFLKNGDRLKGKLDGYKNDSVIFKFQKNKLKFKSSDIISIYFNDSLAPQNINNNIIPKEIIKTDGKISGVVTFFYNKNYGDKPDVGAEVYVADSIKIPDLMYSTIDTFHYGNFYRNISYDYSHSHMKVPNDIKQQLINYNVEDNIIFNDLDLRASKNIDKIKNAKDVIKTVVDGNGNYTIKLKPGIYYIYIKSNNRKGSTVTEILGRVFCERIAIKDDEEINVSAKFDLY